MESLRAVSDSVLLSRVLGLVQRERGATADVIEHLMEIDRRHLYLEQACSSLYGYCRERLGYSEDAALKRVRVARMAARLPGVLDELRSGELHLTGLFVLSQFTNAENWAELRGCARGRSRRELERLLAQRFPRPDVPGSLTPMGCVGADGSEFAMVRGRVEALSALRSRVEFTVGDEFLAKLERAQQLLSHTLAARDLEHLFERALDALLECESRRRFGAERAGGVRRRRRTLKDGSRHTPVDLMGAVWERDGSQCTFTDFEGRRCSERRFLTIEHRVPFALGGPTTLDNLCLLCSSHNAYTARAAFGDDFLARKRVERRSTERRSTERRSAVIDSTLKSEQPVAGAVEKVQSALVRMGFAHRRVTRALAQIRPFASQPPEQVLRAALAVLTEGI
ncbi:MAG: HNH endonuclease signature motif containing protein [Polyangiaceae bacterium]